jgi:hypothetical protein
LAHPSVQIAKLAGLLRCEDSLIVSLAAPPRAVPLANHGDFLDEQMMIAQVARFILGRFRHARGAQRRQRDVDTS